MYLRGPHGVPVTPPKDAHIVCVAGGTGLAAVYQIAEDFGSDDNPVDIFLGARSANRLYFREECEGVARVTIATDDGSAGFEGRVSDALADFLAEQPAEALAKMEADAAGVPVIAEAPTPTLKPLGPGQTLSLIHI